MRRVIPPLENTSQKYGSLHKWQFETDDFYAEVRYIPRDEHVKLTLAKSGGSESYTGDEAYDKIKDLLGYERKWLFHRKDGEVEYLLVKERTARMLRTKFFVSCFSIGDRPGFLRRYVDRLHSQLDIETSPEIEKYDTICSEMLDKRCFGWYDEYSDAKSIIEENVMDIHEESFDYAVIEEVRSGPYPMSEAIAWFKWNDEQEKYIECESPEAARKLYGICF